jgi:hypothetical protein
MLLSRGPEWDKGMDPVEIQEMLDRTMAWFENLNEQGIVRGTQALQRTGCIVSDRSAQVFTDGPFAESKEAIGGYLIVEVDSLEEAIAIAKGCPTLHRGMTIEVRPVLDECPVATRLREQLAADAV